MATALAAASASSRENAIATSASSVATITTSLGSMRFRITSSAAPAAAAEFARLANRGFYDDSALTALHAECIVGGDPRSRLGYGPGGQLLRGGYFYGKVRAWGSDEAVLKGGARTACPDGERCGVERRLPAEQARAPPRFGDLALALGGQPGNTVRSPPGTTGSIWEIHLGTAPPFYGAWPPVFGAIDADDGASATVLRRIAAMPIANDYLVESKGRSMAGAASYARPRDIPQTKIAVLRVRVESETSPGPKAPTPSTARGSGSRLGATPQMLAPPDDAPAKALLSSLRASPRRSALYLGGATAVALAANTFGATSALLSLAPEASRAARLDSWYAVNGFRRGGDPEAGAGGLGGRFAFRYPARLQPTRNGADQGRRRAAGLPVPLTSAGALPVVAFGNGPPRGFALAAGTDESLSVVIGAAPAGARSVADAFGSADEAARRLEQLYARGGGGGISPRRASLLRAAEVASPSGRPLYELEVVVEQQQRSGEAEEALVERVHALCVVGVTRDEQLVTVTYRVVDGAAWSAVEADARATIASVVL